MHFLFCAISSLIAVGLAGCNVSLYEPIANPDHPELPSDLEDNLRQHVQVLAEDIGERNCYRQANYEAAAGYIESIFKEAGLQPLRQPVRVPENDRFQLPETTAYNIEAIVQGACVNNVIVVGAHYDTKVASAYWDDDGTPPAPDRPGTPGASDNASGVAVMLEVARHLAKTKPKYTIRFVAFANEEPPFFLTDSMGSMVYARSMKEQQIDVQAMVCLDTIGCFHETSRRKRKYPVELLGLPYTFDYVTFLGNPQSRKTMKRGASTFQRHTSTPLRVAWIWRISKRIAWSDDASFWAYGYPAFTVTDTAYLRNHHSHEPTDRAGTLDYGPMADIAWAAVFLIKAFANEPQD
ncbi:MAG: M20/M25/M40 family metallo-hydrolase [Phycisphaeraceae bacterium]|nr:M20/M25/M40 family metallo-hydrolase [Phycisphaeraceae bacterium]